MKKLLFTTANNWKFKQAKKYFQNKGIKIEQAVLDLPESRSEEGEQIAKEKARLAFKKLQTPLFVIDAAFHIKALNDFPKTYVKFAEKYLGAEGILKLLEGKTNRNWEFPNYLVYKDGTQERIFVGTINGTFVDNLEHSKDSRVRDFDRIQIPDGYNKTFAEMSEEELEKFRKNTWRPTVFDSFIEWLKKTNPQ